MGKILIVLAIVLLIVWWLRSSARAGSERTPPPSADRSADGPQAIVACAHCGLHLPAHEALPGRGGVFCGEPHRAQFEREHPPS